MVVELELAVAVKGGYDPVVGQIRVVGAEPGRQVALPRRLTAFLLGLQGLVETLAVESEPLLLGELLDELHGDAAGLVEVERDMAGNNRPTGALDPLELAAGDVGAGVEGACEAALLLLELLGHDLVSVPAAPDTARPSSR